MCCSVPIVVAINKCDKYGVNVVSLCKISDPRIACQAYVLNLYSFPKRGLDYVLHSEFAFLCCIDLLPFEEESIMQLPAPYQSILKCTYVRRMC